MVEHRGRGPSAVQEAPDPQREGALQGDEPREYDGREQPPARDAVPVPWISQPAREGGFVAGDLEQALRMEAAHDAALDGAVTAERLDDGLLVAVPFQVDLEADVRGALAEEGKRLVEGRQGGRDRPKLRERHSSDASAPGAVAHLPEVVGVRKHERPVVEIEDVELDDVAAELNCPLERLERVLGSERGGAFVADS